MATSSSRRVFVVLIWEGAIEQFFSPAELAMVPRLVADDQLLAARANGSGVCSAGQDPA
jgi:hypothetical protein